MIVAENPSRRRKARRKSSRRRRSRNPGAISLGRIPGAVFSGYRPAFLKQVAPIAIGMAANFAITELAAKYIPDVRKGFWSYLFGFGVAGVMGIVPRYGAALALGAGAYQMGRGINDYAMPVVKKALNLGELVADEDPSGLNDLYEGGMNELVGPEALPMGELWDGTGIQDAASPLEVVPG